MTTSNKNLIPFLTGNSEVKCGFIELGNSDADLDIKLLLEGEFDQNRIDNIKDYELKYAKQSVSCTVILLDIPAFLIPQDFIQFLGSYSGTQGKLSYNLFSHGARPYMI